MSGKCENYTFGEWSSTKDFSFEYFYPSSTLCCQGLEVDKKVTIILQKISYFFSKLTLLEKLNREQIYAIIMHLKNNIQKISILRTHLFNVECLIIHQCNIIIKSYYNSLYDAFSKIHVDIT